MSHFEEVKKQSSYHFNNDITDRPNDWFTVFGRFTNVWQEDLSDVKKKLMPMGWYNIRSTCGGAMGDGTNPNLQKQEQDILMGNGNPKMTLVDINDQLDGYASFNKIIDFLKLDRSKRLMSRMHIQNTGQVFNYHIDTLHLLFPGIPEDRIIRIVVMLEDWQPGQFILYGNLEYSRCKAGDVHWFKWKDVPHATANASSYPRCSLQLTGVMTDHTLSLLHNPADTVYHI